MLNNVKDAPFLATGDGTTDDRAAIQRAISDAAADPAKAGIFFPAGTYRVSRVNVAPEIGGCSLDLNGLRDFMVMGEGPRSVVQLLDQPNPVGDWHVFLLRNCQRVVFKDLLIDGNRSGLPKADEHSAGIQADAGTEDLVVDRCIMRHCFGDGFRLLSTNEPQQTVKRLRLENCLFQKNKRSGVAIQRGVEQIIIANCVFDANDDDNSIDIEPSGTPMPTDVLIQGCIINHTNPTKAVLLEGTSQNNPLVRCKFTDNIVIGGPVQCLDVDQLTIQNNIVFVTRHLIPVELHLGGDSVIITDNLIVTTNATSEAVIALKGSDLDTATGNPHPIRRALIANNLCIAASGSGITCESGNGVVIQGNMIVATDSCGSGISLKSAVGAMDDIAVRDNDITFREETDEKTGKWVTGVFIGSTSPNAALPYPIGHLSVTGNSIRNALTGVEFINKNFTQTPVCALNRIAADVGTPLIGIGELPAQSLVVGGAMSRGGTSRGSGAGRLIAGLGDPNTRMIGNVGDIFQRLDGKPGATVYLKETGDNTNTDWTPIRAPQKTIVWVNHVDLLPGDASVTTSFKVGSNGVGTGLVVRSSTTGQDTLEGRNKVLHMGLQVPPGYSIRGVRVCYELSNKRSFISQIRLAQEQTPQGAIVKLDDPTDHTNPGPICIDSAATTIDPSLGEVLLSLRVNFGNISDKIVVRAVGLHLSPV